jgi:hypothetical protein
MTFHAYLDNIAKQTGVTADEWVKLATSKGFTKSGTKATQITDWLRGPTTSLGMVTPWPSSSCSRIVRPADLESARADPISSKAGGFADAPFAAIQG